MKVLITEDIHESFLNLLKKKGVFIDQKLEVKSINDLKKILNQYDGFVVRSRFSMDKDLLSTAPNLKFIARAGAGMDNIDEKYCNENNIQLFNAPEGNRDAVAEHTLGLLLNLLRNINTSSSEIKNKIWSRESNRGVELGGKTVGIIGYGNAGKSLAKRLTGFNVKCIAYDKYLSDYSDSFAEEVSIELLQKEADIISLHIPLSSDSCHLINDDFFEKLAKPIFLLNTSRGKVIKTSDLVHYLKNGKVLGVALDVLENENIQALSEEEKIWFEYLTVNKNVILTSHIAGWTFESYQKIAEVLASKIIAKYNLG